jgi:hypothetical protein
LNSERIRQEFGSFGIDVIESGQWRRISSLYSLENDAKVCRTFAIVEFDEAMRPALAEEHALVLSGRSIGAVFKDRGWTINKRHTRMDSVTLTRDDRDVTSSMRLDPPQQVALHAYVFEVRKGRRAHNYATITELHHPHYLTEADVRSIYGEPAVPGNPAQARVEAR